MACQIVLPLWPEVCCRVCVCACACVTEYVCLNMINSTACFKSWQAAGAPETQSTIFNARSRKKAVHFYLYVVLSTLRSITPPFVCFSMCACVCVCVPNESGGCGDSALAVPQWPTLFRCYNQGGRGSWPGHPGVSAALDTQVLQPNAAPESRGSGLFNKKKKK